MELSAGQRLSHYEVLGTLGAGGMGVVYRARDTRLDREVALKVLPEALVEDEAQLARFEREAKLLAALNHPQVAAIYGIDHVDGVHFLTLELVPGQTLRQRLAGGPLPVEEAVQVAQQIAAGLQAAHATGIVHRDLKPGNVMIRPDGTVKILDFGLAKQTDVADRAPSEPITEAFQVMGTPGYLSPEQASGEIADERADVWAFGCILYECLTGLRAFPGDTVGERIRAMFEATPDYETLPAETPPTVRLVVSRCLARESSSRLRGIGDVRLLLEGALEHESQTSGIQHVVVQAPPRPQRWPWAAAAGGLLVAGLFAILSPWERDPPPAGPAIAREILTLPLGTHLGWRETSAALSKLGRASQLIAVSPDGTRVAYCVERDNRSEIHIHVAGGNESIPLPGTEDGRAPFFSPDGKKIGFQAKNSLKVVPADASGPAISICEVVSSNFSGCWSPDGAEIIYSTRDGLRSVSPNDPPPTPQPLTNRDLEAGEFEHLQPTMVTGDLVLFTIATGTSAHIALYSRSAETTTRVVRQGTSPRFAGGRLFYAHEGGVRVVPFDPAKASEVGLADHLLPKVYTTPGSGGGSVTAHFDVSTNGVLAFVPAPDSEPTSIARWVPRDSEGIGAIFDRGSGIWKHPRLSPDEQYYVVDVLDAAGRKNIRKFEFEREAESWPTQDGMTIMSAWHPDRGVTVRHTHLPLIRLMLGPDKPFPVDIGLQGTIYADSWSPDGGTLFLTVKTPKGYSVWSHTRGDAKAQLLFDDDKTARFAQVSPDGHWLAYVAKEKEDGKLEVFLRAYRPRPGDRIKVSQDGGGEPIWSKDGKEIFFRNADGAMHFVAMDTAPRFKIEQPWSNEYDIEPGGHQHYDVSRDGRFLMIENIRIVPNRVHLVSMPEPAAAR